MFKARQALASIANGLAVVAIVVALFLALASSGIIFRPASEQVTFGG